MIRTFLLAGALSGLLLPSPALAQSGTATSDNSAAAIAELSKVTKAQDFVTLAAMSDAFEIEAGQMAADQAGSDEVRQFGQMLVTDHGNASKELMGIAQAAQLNATPPAMDQRHQVILDSLKDAKGPGFDSAFAQSQVAAHQEGIALFKAYAENGDNDQLKAFARKGLPVLQKHLEVAQKLAGMPPAQ